MFLEFFKTAYCKGHDSHLRMKKKSVYELCSWSSSERVAVVYSLDCCLLAVSLSRACSFSSTTNIYNIFSWWFVSDNFVPGGNCCECLQTGLALSEVTASDNFSSLHRTKLWHLHHGWPLSKLLNVYVSTRFRSFLVHGLQTTCDDDGNCSNAIPTDFNFL
jgi:hypothetical protein